MSVSVYICRHIWKTQRSVAFVLCNELMLLLATVCDSNAAWAHLSVFLTPVSSVKSGMEFGIGCLEKCDVKLLRVPAVLAPICNSNIKYSRLASE